jgi:polynucleotide 5'-hydroxyl-kinase GRC3/NOL9
MAIREHPSWRAAPAELQTARTIVLLGATDVGKTTFLTWLANGLSAQGRRVGVVDADVGQSSLGPPTTIGVGVVTQPMQSLQELAPHSLFFVGSTSPRGHLLPMVVGTKRMMDRALALGVDHVLIDTCGFITGQGGRALQHYTIHLLDPDAVVCLQQASECEGLLVAYRRRQRPRILRLHASPACRRRGIEERQMFRGRALQRYFADSTRLTLSWDHLDLVDTPLWYGTPIEGESDHDLRHQGLSDMLWMERAGRELLLVTRERPAPSALAAIERTTGLRVRVWSLGALHGTLLGLLDHTADLLGLGILRQIDFVSHRLDVLASCGGNGVRGVQWSQTHIHSLQAPLFGGESSQPA